MPARKCGTCDVEVRDQVAICRRCESELRRRLVDQPEHRAQLELELRRETRKHELLKAANLEWRIPFNDAASELIRRQLRLVGGWVATLAKLTPPTAGPACHRCTHRSCNIVRRDRPPAGDLAARTVWLASRVGMLRRRPEARSLLESFRKLDRDIIALVDLPANRQRIPVGPCPNMWDHQDAGVTYCPGQIDAVFPLDDAAPCHMECTACEERWPSWQWNRTGSRILARAEQLEAQQQLAKTIGGAA